MTPVNSSTIKSVHHDDATETLTVEFKSGGMYTYYKVPRTVFRELTLAPSSGKYFAANIKGTYQFQKLGSTDTQGV